MQTFKTMHENLARLYTFLTRDSAMRNKIDRVAMEFAISWCRNQTLIKKGKFKKGDNFDENEAH